MAGFSATTWSRFHDLSEEQTAFTDRRADRCHDVAFLFSGHAGRRTVPTSARFRNPKRWWKKLCNRFSPQCQAGFPCLRVSPPRPSIR